MKPMDPGALLILLVIGLAAGWLAGRIMGSAGFGIVGDLVVGVVGAVVGGWLFAALGIVAIGLFGVFIAAVVGAVVLLAILRVVKRA